MIKIRILLQALLSLPDWAASNQSNCIWLHIPTPPSLPTASVLTLPNDTQFLNRPPCSSASCHCAVPCLECFSSLSSLRSHCLGCRCKSASQPVLRLSLQENERFRALVPLNRCIVLFCVPVCLFC